jgi:AraC family transcriptional regulator of adaptative response/methylated-DNA-[protein]-cysteine methyltransferase
MSPATHLDETSAWHAVAERDRQADGRFVFAVTTTGIYCRPSCPARRPRRTNVRFFAGPDAAEAAGFRACRRCRPRETSRDPALQRAEAARVYLEARLEETVTLAQLAAAVGGSPWHLQRCFKRCFGLTPRQWVNARRLERVRETLRDAPTVTDAVYEAGFVDGRQLYEQSDRRLGMTPGRWRRGGAGARVRFATAGSALGRVLVAATERGVCAVMLGDDDGALEEALRRQLPAATVEAAGPELAPWLEEVVHRSAGEAPSRQLPLDVRATAFQERVWQELCRIPRGETRTYGEIAASLGRPTAARAVAQACARNPVAVAVPCHRVVPAAGGAGGYRWGTERKRRLLSRESSAAAAETAQRCEDRS